MKQMTDKQFNRMVGGVLKKLRVQQGLSAKQLSDKIDMAVPNLFRLEAGRRGLGVKLLFKILVGMGLTWDGFVEHLPSRNKGETNDGSTV